MPAGERRLPVEGVFIMLTVLLKILSILGMLLLILLGAAVLFLLLVLFFPITYHISGKKNEEEVLFWASAVWLFGLLRFQYRYPRPGNALVKVLWFTVFDSKHPPKKDSAGAGQESGASDDKKTAAGQTQEGADASEKSSAGANGQSSSQADSAPSSGREAFEKQEEAGAEVPLSFWEKIQRFLMEKYEKMRYTFYGIYDKIKHIRDNISYYKALLDDEETVLLFQHAKKRLGRILHSIRPRKLQADILFGADSPDITGYLYGVYGMLSPGLGKKVSVTPDFTREVLEGEFYAAGHITVFHLLWHGGILFFDKRLHLFLIRLKGGRNGR